MNLAVNRFGHLPPCPKCGSKLDCLTFWTAQLRAARIFLRPKAAYRAQGRCDCCGCDVAWVDAEGARRNQRGV